MVSNLRQFISRVLGSESGQALVEYGLILSLIALAALAGITAFGGGVDGLYGTLEAAANAMVGSS
jgi:Flp pilus assembly pilin Flp